MARSSPSRAISLPTAILPDRGGARSMSPGRSSAQKEHSMRPAVPAPPNDGVISRLFAIAKDHEDTCRRLTDGARGIDVQLQILRDEHTQLRAENEALVRCLCRAGVILSTDFNAELKGVVATAETPATPAALTGWQQPRQSSLSRCRGRSVEGDRQDGGFSDTMTSGSTELPSPDPHSLVQKLIDGGISPKEQQKTLRAVQRALKSPEVWATGEPPLSMVVKAGRTDLVHMLLRSGVNPNEGCPKGVMPLHVATFEGNASICRILIQGRADVDGKDRHGQTPIFFAPSPEVCKQLVEQRTNLNILNSRGQSALHLAGRAGLEDVLNWLGERCTPALVDLRDVQGNTAYGYVRKFQREEHRAPEPTSGEHRSKAREQRASSRQPVAHSSPENGAQQSLAANVIESPATMKPLPSASELLVSPDCIGYENGRSGRPTFRDPNCSHANSKADEGGARNGLRQKGRGHFAVRPRNPYVSGSAAYAAAGADALKRGTGDKHSAPAAGGARWNFHQKNAGEDSRAAATEEVASATRRAGSGASVPFAASSKVASAARQSSANSTVVGSTTNGTGRMSNRTDPSSKTDVVLEAAAAVATAAVHTLAKLEESDHARPNQHHKAPAPPAIRVVQPQPPESAAEKAPIVAETADDDGDGVEDEEDEEGEYAEGEEGEEEYAEGDEEEAPVTDAPLSAAGMWDDQDEVY